MQGSKSSVMNAVTSDAEGAGTYICKPSRCCRTVVSTPTSRRITHCRKSTSALVKLCVLRYRPRHCLDFLEPSSMNRLCSRSASVFMDGVVVSRSFLPRSACRHAVQTIPSPVALCDGALVVVVEVSGFEPPNLLIVRTGQIVTAHVRHTRSGVRHRRVLPDSRMSQHTPRVLFHMVTHDSPHFVKATAPVKLPTWRCS